MLNWLKNLARGGPPAPAREALPNDGLELAMDWGETWLAPIQDRLRQRHPQLNPEQLDELNEACQGAMKFGHATAYELAQAGGPQVAPEACAARVLAQYPWLSADNAERLQRQSLYFVWKAGGPKPGR